jgi:hypothetical protein
MKKRLLFILCLFFVAANSSAAQTRNVTNSDLEKFRQKRLQAEKEFRENHAKLGFPSPEDLEKQNAESRRRLSELSEQIEAENADNQNPFEARASALRTQIASVEAQIDYLRGELNRLPQQNLFFSTVYFPSRNRRFGGGIYRAPNNFPTNGFPRVAPFPISSAGVVQNRAINAPTNRSPISNGGARVASPLAGQAGNSYNGENGARRYGGERRNGGGIVITLGGAGNYGCRNVVGLGSNCYGGNYGFPVIYGGGYVAPYFSGGNRSYERDDLVIQIRALEQARAGLYAERSVLEDEARRAGVKID